MGSGTGDPNNSGRNEQAQHRVTSANGATSESGARTKVPGSNAHSRSLSGSILSKLSFLRASSEQLPRQEDAVDEEGSVLEDDETTPRRSNAMMSAIRESKSRKRKGSLRKKAILGTGKLKLEGRERRNSLLDHQKRAPDTYKTPSRQGIENSKTDSVDSSPVSSGDLTPRRFSYEHPTATSSSETGWPNSPPPLHKILVKTTSENQNIQSEGDDTTMKLPMINPSSYPYTSTTDDDEGLTFSLPPSASMLSHSAAKKSSQVALPVSGAFYGAQAHGLTNAGPRRRTSQKSHPTHPLHTSPLSHPPLAALEEEWDYSETEWWGWVVLIVTWLVFVVGMGSCLGVWSWAWDVGETPYAPPELEDDPTLPIVGYYPALIVMTAVMAWVWVVVAWVGMKYFRHAKVVAD